MAKGDDLQERLVGFAVAMVKICDGLSDTKAGIHIASQLLRSGTSAAPNYAEARGAESDKDFIHKLKLVLKELNESLVWLAIIRQGELRDVVTIRKAEEECAVLCRIIAASINTVKKRCGMEKNKTPERPGVNVVPY